MREAKVRGDAELGGRFRDLIDHRLRKFSRLVLRDSDWARLPAPLLPPFPLCPNAAGRVAAGAACPAASGGCLKRRDRRRPGDAVSLQTLALLKGDDGGFRAGAEVPVRAVRIKPECLQFLLQILNVRTR
jgi:hypothetical protein